MLDRPITLSEKTLNAEEILISPAAYFAWQEKAATVAREVTKLEVIDPESIPDERAKPIDGGALLIWVDLPSPTGRVELVVPKGQLAWRNRPN